LLHETTTISTSAVAKLLLVGSKDLSGRQPSLPHWLAAAATHGDVLTSQTNLGPPAWSRLIRVVVVMKPIQAYMNPTLPQSFVSPPPSSRSIPRTFSASGIVAFVVSVTLVSSIV
jgi:hypothetical protein